MANKWIMMMPQVEMKTFCFLKDFSMQEWNSFIIGEHFVFVRSMFA